MRARTNPPDASRTPSARPPATTTRATGREHSTTPPRRWTSARVSDAAPPSGTG
ncbi:hypothetical protein K7G98_22520 [Saccharothrix sp. MB29]|nr:hypothetical protein [Saccharothrix sp. MB29]